MNTEALRDAIGGDVVTPDDRGWDTARQAWNLVADQHPALVVIAQDVGDIATTVSFARANDLRVAPQSTGHGATSLGDLSGAILLRTARLNGVTIDAAAQTARVQAGALWRDVVAPAAEHGLVALHGMSGVVGVAGYTLGGGIGWLARREGFASSHVRSFDVVTASGEARHVDAEHEPDLFWALRGGGGGPVIVTSLEIELFPLREVYAGALMWPIEQASEIVDAYREWIQSVPEAVTSTLKLMRFPPDPAVPEPLRGKALSAVTLAFTGTADGGNELVAPLRAVAAPYLDTLGTVPGAALADLSGDPSDPMPGIGGSLLLDTLSPEVGAAYVDLAGPGVQSPLISLEIRHLGGALRNTTPDPGPAGPLDSEALVYGVGAPITPEVGAALRETLAAVRERLSPWASTRESILTFEEQDRGLRRSFDSGVVERLTGIAAANDPDGLFVPNHVAD